MKPGPYRFWGNIDPRTRQKHQILAAVPETDSAGGVATMHLYDPIDSYGEFWGVSAKEFTQALAQLPDDTTDIHLHINSPGGEVWEGVAITNALRNHPATVTSFVDGIAASAASFVAAASDVVVMGRNTQLMIHDAWGLAIGPAADMHAMGDLLDKISNNIASIYQEKAGGDVADWRALMLAETWYDAEEAVAAGLADRVQAPASDAPSDGFDLSVFKGRTAPPAQLAPASTPKLDAAAVAAIAARSLARQHQLTAENLATA